MLDTLSNFEDGTNNPNARHSKLSTQSLKSHIWRNVRFLNKVPPEQEVQMVRQSRALKESKQECRATVFFFFWQQQIH